jgi:hypothetical protein
VGLRVFVDGVKNQRCRGLVSRLKFVFFPYVGLLILGFKMDWLLFLESHIFVLFGIAFDYLSKKFLEKKKLINKLYIVLL